MSKFCECTFGVKSGKLLGFVVSQKGIEVDLDKVKAILEMSGATYREASMWILGMIELH